MGTYCMESQWISRAYQQWQGWCSQKGSLSFNYLLPYPTLSCKRVEIHSIEGPFSVNRARASPSTRASSASWKKVCLWGWRGGGGDQSTGTPTGTRVCGTIWHFHTADQREGINPAVGSEAKMRRREFSKYCLCGCLAVGQSSWGFFLTKWDTRVHPASLCKQPPFFS